MFAAGRCCEVSGADVCEDFFSGRLLAFAVQLHHRDEVRKRFLERRFCDICHLDFEAFAEVK